jgi:hypothetical protein
MVKLVPISNGKAYAIVDDEDFEYVSQFTWELAAGYARRTVSSRRVLGKRQQTRALMHREINRTPEGMMTDHINRNPLDNRKENLRTCTSADNQRNHGKRNIPTSSKYKGVFWDKKNNKWKASIKVYGKNFHLGRFECEEDAALAYNVAASTHFGDFAGLNTNIRIS